MTAFERMELDYDMLNEELSDAYRTLGDLEAEYGSEVSAFGDSGPGTLDRLLSAKEDVALLEERIRIKGLEMEAIRGLIPWSKVV